MQYTSKIALLAVALFSTSALAVPFAGEAEYDVEAREFDNDLSTREFYEAYMEARADPSLDARDLESLDFEAREYIEYLEARQAATVATPQTPLSARPSRVEAKEQSKDTKETTGEKGPKVYLTKHQKAVRRATKIAAKKFEDVDFYKQALSDVDSKYHRYAVAKYLSKPQNLKKAFKNSRSPYHKAAKRVVHHNKAKIYLKDEKNYEKALAHKRNKFHKDAVKMYLSQGTHFQKALTNEKSPYHKAAVHEYLLDTKTRHRAILDKEHPFHKQAMKLQKKINKHHRRHHKQVASDSLTANSTTTATPQA